MAVLGNAKHEAVALAYLADPQKIGARAYRAVYPKSSQHAAETAFGRLLKIAEFAARLAELGAKAAEGAVMTAHEVLLELSKLGRANMADYMRVGPDGDPVLDYSRLTRDQAAALAEVTVEDFKDGREDRLEGQPNGGALKRSGGREVRRVKFKLAPKTSALDLLGKHHKLFVERVEHDLSAGVAEQLTAALARVDGKQDRRRDDEGKQDRRAPRKRDARKAARTGKHARAR